jgi:hypothetical protein
LGWNALTGGTGETDFINNQGGGTGGFAFMNTPASGTLRTTLMVIAGGGNVGIGTSSPSARLSVASPAGENQGSAFSTTLRTSAGALDSAVNSDLPLASFCCSVDNRDGLSLGIHALRTAAAPQGWQSTAIVLGMDVDNTRRAGATLTLHNLGNVGIGTTAPFQKLSVTGTESSFNGFGAAIGISNAAPGGRNWYLRAGATGTATPAGGISIADDTDYRLVVDSSGNVGIGTSTPNPNAKLDVNGRIMATGIGAGPAYLSVVAINLDENDIRRDGQPTSPLVVHGDVQVIGGGNLKVDGDVILMGADCAEEFDATVGKSIDPGTVVVIDETGALRESREAYDKKVAGVVSGAGDYRHGLVLDKRASEEGRIPVALVGKVYCKVDAQYSPIDVGDMLTTSQTPGHAMKALDPTKAFGSVIGKALRPLQEGMGLIPILIALQ